DLPLVDRPVCRRPAIAGEATLRTFSPSKLLWAKFPSGKSEPQLALQPTGYAAELLAHPPRTGKVQTEPNPSPKAPHTKQELRSRYPSINAWFHARRDKQERRPVQSRFQPRCGQAREGYSPRDRSTHLSEHHQSS